MHGQARAASLIVPDYYPTIQAAIDAASTGDTIVVRPGTYSENLTLNKSVILTAESFDSSDPTHNTTIIDGGSEGLIPAISIPSGVSPMPVVRGFTIRYGADGINARSEANLTGMDNYTRRIDRVQLGAVSGIDSGTRGSYYFDAFVSHRQIYIGP